MRRGFGGASAGGFLWGHCYWRCEAIVWDGDGRGWTVWSRARIEIENKKMVRTIGSREGKAGEVEWARALIGKSAGDVIWVVGNTLVC